MPVFSDCYALYSDTQENATRIAQAVSVQQESVGKPILTLRDAIAAGSFFDRPGPADVVNVGDAKGVGGGWRVWAGSHIIKPPLLVH